MMSVLSAESASLTASREGRRRVASGTSRLMRADGSAGTIWPHDNPPETVTSRRQTASELFGMAAQ